jgi:hypothetical protein
MKSKKTLIALAIAGALTSAGAVANEGGYRGWGPMANLETPYSPVEAGPVAFDQEMRDRAMHVAEVQEARESVWVANTRFREHHAQDVAESRPSMLFEPFRQLARFFNRSGN